MGIAERIYEVVKDLSDAMAAEVLDHAEAKRARTAQSSPQAARLAGAFALIENHAGKCKAVKFNRADLYERAGLR